jgi:hypothetical protein
VFGDELARVREGRPRGRRRHSCVHLRPLIPRPARSWVFAAGLPPPPPNKTKHTGQGPG